MNEWSPRSLTNAILRPSGDHVGLPLMPYARNSGGVASRSCDAASPGLTGARWICPSRTYATHFPSGESWKASAWTTRHGLPPLVLTAQTARSAPRGSLDGLATHPSRFRVWPRMKATMEPSSEIWRSERSTPSSSVNEVSRTGSKSGAAAVYTFRMPRSNSIHAMRSALRAATRSYGKLYETTSSIENRGFSCCAATRDGDGAASDTARTNADAKRARARMRAFGAPVAAQTVRMRSPPGGSCQGRGGGPPEPISRPRRPRFVSVGGYNAPALRAAARPVPQARRNEPAVRAVRGGSGGPGPRVGPGRPARGRDEPLSRPPSPPLVRRRAVDRRQRHVQQPQVHAQLTTVVDQVVDVLPH